MDWSPQLPLSYCTNVHPGLTVAEVLQGLDQHTLAARQKFNRPLAAGLWLAAPVIAELQESPDGIRAFAAELARRDLPCYTLNAFPYGNFHQERVKEQVYLPDWTTAERRDYTLGCARVLAALLPEGVDGSISTVPLGFKELSDRPDFLNMCVEQLLATAKQLATLARETGRTIRLAIEPEPCCVLETTEEARTFFRRLFQEADEQGLGDVAREHLGVCYDICHQSVEFEDVDQSIRQLAADGIRINKVHITCALELRDPGKNEAARRQLATFAEPRYLHQTFAWTRESHGDIIRHVVDLTPELALDPPDEFLTADYWRIHFHVPVDAETVGELGTTRDDLRRALKAVRELPYTPHLEVETYTWGVLPGEQKPELSTGLARELDATWQLLRAL